MASHDAQTLESLLAEAEAAAAERVPVAAFITSLDWNLPHLARDAGPYAEQASLLIADAIDRAAAGELDLTPAAIRALGRATATMVQAGRDPSAASRVQAELAGAGIVGRVDVGMQGSRGGRPTSNGPAARPAAVGPVSAAGRSAEPAPPTEVDPSLDPEIARMTGRIAPRSSALAPLGVLGLGWAVVLSLVVGLGGGIWLDGRLGSAPLGTIVGLVVGLLLAWLAARSLVRRSRDT